MSKREMNNELYQLIRKQINLELYSYYIYLAMANYCDTRLKFPGAAKWLRIQAQEEMSHAHKFNDHLVYRGILPTLDSIPNPPEAFGSTLKEVFLKALEHEHLVTDKIVEITMKARDVEDFRIRTLLNWFNTEQIEEEDIIQKIIDKLIHASKDPAALLEIDEKLGER